MSRREMMNEIAACVLFTITIVSIFALWAVAS